MASQKKADSAVVAGAPAPVAAVVPAPAPAPEKPKAAKARDLTPEEAIAELQVRIAVDTARIEQLQRKRNFQEFPKMVKGHIFNSRADQDAAGPEYQDA